MTSIDLFSEPRPAARTAKPQKAEQQSREADLLQEVSAKLDRLAAVLAAQGKEKDRQIEILSAAGCESGFIGTVVGMTAASVRKFQSRQRRKAASTQADQTNDQELPSD